MSQSFFPRNNLRKKSNTISGSHEVRGSIPLGPTQINLQRRASRMPFLLPVLKSAAEINEDTSGNNDQHNQRDEQPEDEPINHALSFKV